MASKTASASSTLRLSGPSLRVTEMYPIVLSFESASEPLSESGLTALMTSSWFARDLVVALTAFALAPLSSVPDFATRTIGTVPF